MIITTFTESVVVSDNISKVCDLMAMGTDSDAE